MVSRGFSVVFSCFAGIFYGFYARSAGGHVVSGVGRAGKGQRWRLLGWGRIGCRSSVILVLMVVEERFLFLMMLDVVLTYFGDKEIN